jgi:uncharacterized protein YbbC (DUF1343 family)
VTVLIGFALLLLVAVVLSALALPRWQPALVALALITLASVELTPAQRALGPVVVAEERAAARAPGALVGSEVAPLRAGPRPIPPPPSSEPPPPGFDAIDGLVNAAIGRHDLPGAVVVVGRRERVIYQKAFGLRQILPLPEAMTEDTIFDVASLTKPLATAMAVMVLVDRKQLELDAPLRRYVAGFDGKGKREITLRQLLTHVSGLPAESPYDDYEHGWGEAIERLAALKLKAQPGQRFIYSDVGFIMLQEVVRKVSGMDLSAFVQKNVYGPLGMSETLFLPPKSLIPRIAPTEFREDVWIRGDVHDPRAWRLGGVCGHAGLFSTAKDLVRYAQMMLSWGELDGKRVLSAKALATMTAPNDVPGGIRALGWDVQSRYSLNRGTALSRRAYGHGGYTGTALWIDPEQDLFVVFLSNRVHPDGKGSVNQLAGDIATTASNLLASPEPTAPPSAERRAPVKLGIDVLAAEGFGRLQGERVALLTNDSARDGGGTRTADRLAAASGVKLVALLSPEHGLGADKDTAIKDGNDQKLALPVHSLYGKIMAPTPKMLAGVDVVVIDLPDAGVRFYTYASTMHATLRVAARMNLRVVVLDRPDPLNGQDVEGPLLHASERNFVNHHPLPMRHGMTIGELAEMINADEHLTNQLEVVRMQGYRRGDYYDQTGVPWWPPSPNLRTIEQVVLYPATALVEGTNVSVGRGTERPFEVVGAPWVDAEELASTLSGMSLIGVTFKPLKFTPSSSVHAGKECQGVAVTVVDRPGFEPVRTGIAIALALRKLYKASWKTARLHEMIGSPAVTSAILNQRPLADIEALWKDDLNGFKAKRTKYLLYPPSTPAGG